MLEWRRRNTHCLQQQAKNFQNLPKTNNEQRKENQNKRGILNNIIMFIGINNIARKIFTLAITGELLKFTFFYVCDSAV